LNSYSKEKNKYPFYDLFYIWLGNIRNQTKKNLPKVGLFLFRCSPFSLNIIKKEGQFFCPSFRSLFVHRFFAQYLNTFPPAIT